MKFRILFKYCKDIHLISAFSEFSKKIIKKKLLFIYFFFPTSFNSLEEKNRYNFKKEIFFKIFH